MSRHFYLRHDGFDVRVRPGTMVLGRASNCELVLTSTRVSRRHAKVTFTDAGLAVQDLNSANGVFVNGERIQRPTKLVGGDELMLADEVLTVVPGRPRPSVSFGATLPGAQPDTLPNAKAPFVNGAAPVPAVARSKTAMTDSTVREDVLALIGTVADKMLAMGKVPEAQRILRPRLKEVLERARAGADVPESVAEAAGRYAVKLAEAARDPDWIEYALELHTALRRPLPGDVIEFLYTALRTIPPIELELLRQYIGVLETASGELQPGQRFLVKRIRGLEGLAAAR